MRRRRPAGEEGRSHQHQRNRRGSERRRADDSYYGRRPGVDAGTIPPSAAAWIPLLSRRLGIETKQQREVLLVALMVFLLAAWFLTPLADHTAAAVLCTVPIDADVDLGKEALRSMEQKYPPAADRWGVRRIGSELVRAAGHVSHQNNLFENVRRYEWDFGVIRAPLVNAFALPGGIVRVTDALLDHLALTDGELAALIGHEMGHVLRRHTQKRAVKGRLLSTIWEALVYEDHDGHDESFGEAVGEILWNSASYLGELSFSRADEYQADEAAWDLLASTYSGARQSVRKYHPGSVRRLLKKLWDYEGGSGDTAWEGTHPGTKDRIQSLKKKWNSLSLAERRRFV